MTYPEPCQVIHIQRQVITVQRQVITVLYYAKATHGSTKCIQKINGYCTINVTTNVNAEGREIFFKNIFVYHCSNLKHNYGKTHNLQKQLPFDNRTKAY